MCCDVEFVEKGLHYRSADLRKEKNVKYRFRKRYSPDSNYARCETKRSLAAFPSCPMHKFDKAPLASLMSCRHRVHTFRMECSAQERGSQNLRNRNPKTFPKCCRLKTWWIYKNIMVVLKEKFWKIIVRETST